MARHAQVAEHLVGEDFAQPRRARSLRVVGQRAQVQIVGLGQAQQHLGGDGALITL
jgi:hypothetical protein